jgi:hypothetical protein
MTTTTLPADTVEMRADSRWPDLRSRVVLDTSPERPEDDGAQPIIELVYTEARGWHADLLDLTAGGGLGWPEYQAALDAAEHFGGDFDRLERYLRIFHGCTALDIMSDRSGGVYIGCDPAAWREHVGAPEGADLGEWRDYLQGDVFGVVVEKLVTWAEVGGDREMSTWDHQDSLWGLYGWHYAQSTAESMLFEAGAELEVEARA